MTEREKRKFIEYLKLETRLIEARNQGSLLMFEGRYTEASDIASACVFNDCGYRVEDIWGEGGKSNEVIFVEREKKKS